MSCRPEARIDLPPFSLKFVRVAHSIPEAQALAITTPRGVVLHTGDWKLDPQPLIGPPTDEAAFARLGDHGVLAMVCDSTNAMVEGHSGSEAEVRQSLSALIRSLRGRVAVTCFASNVARLESVALAARDADRSVALVGRSLRNIEAAARECGYLRDIPAFVREDEAGSIPDDNLLILVTGSQGEARSALARIAMDTHPNIALGEGDTVLFSSRVIPGNERAILAVQDNLVRRGVRLMTDMDHLVHVSGHPARDELRKLYRLVRPRYAIPVHGEWRHLSAHAALAQEAGAAPILMEDGDILRLAPGAAEVVDSAPVGRLAVDGNRLVPLNGGVMSARRRMLFNGLVLASLAMDEVGPGSRHAAGERARTVRAGRSGSRTDHRRIRGSGRGPARSIAPRRRGVDRCGAGGAAPGAGPSAREAAAGGRSPATGLSRSRELVQRRCAVYLDLVDRAIRRPPVRDARGERSGRTYRLAWRTGTALPAA